MITTTQPLVSVIIITYKSAKYVLETLESVKAQSWKNIELIISDDASPDNTVQLCEDWIKNNRNCFSETKIITVDKNTGISSNCNRGIRAANGEWLKLIAGDDVLLENCIKDNLEYSKCFPEAAFIVSDLQEIDENGKLLRENVINEGLIFFANRQSNKKQLKAYSRWPAFLNSPSFFCKKDLMEIIGYCDEEFKIYEDMCMIFKIIDKDIKIHYLNKPTVKYRIHQNSASRKESIDEVREKEAFEIFKKYQMKNLNLFNPLDLSVYYESWLRFKYKGFNGHKGLSILLKLSLFYWYLKFNGVKTH